MARLPIRSSVAAVVLLTALALSRPALAGPPLLCHPFDIGSARSLPWDGSGGWFDARKDYDVTNLANDTEALLTPATPILARMETLRRAAIYASADRQALSDLLGRLNVRARSTIPAGANALALLDLAYFVEALRQITRLATFREQAPMIRALIGTTDGYALVQQSIAARPDDPALHFAAALIAADTNPQAYERHSAKARTGAAQDALLARNIAHVGG